MPIEARPRMSDASRVSFTRPSLGFEDFPNSLQGALQPGPHGRVQAACDRAPDRESRRLVCDPQLDLHRVAARSEEHTSELQSHVNLVCRLLLEKKKKK